MLRRAIWISALGAMALWSSGCSRHMEVRLIETTAYDKGKESCGWKRGFPDFWNKYWASGPLKGRPYSGKTASGTWPRQYYPGLLSADSLKHPFRIPFRLIFPWRWLPHDGTIAADTRYYPFGTEMYVEGYGWGVVEDRGSAIQGPERIDLYHKSHRQALRWGRRKIDVVIYFDD
ncbi:3D domain-containing protein [Candidatus Sumerlaeota bacterium]|nr:3D domain-containing protein [Candidatus Sumerlaeota bacterium]